MKHPGPILFWVLLVTIVPTIPAAGQDEKGAVTQVLNDYIRVFGSFDAQRVVPYYHEPLTVLGAQRVAVMSTRADIEASLLKPLYARLKERGWDARSEWAELQVKQMSALLAVASGLTVRRKVDGQELERVGATYLLRKTSDGWKIAVVAVHDPGSVLRLD